MNNTTQTSVSIPVSSIGVNGVLRIPDQPSGIVLFAHGAGSDRLSPRNTYVAQILHEAGFGTLLMDLLTKEEDAVYENRFNIDLLTERLIMCTHWMQQHEIAGKLPLGYFGASTGAAAAIKAATGLGKAVKTVVSRGGRPDLASNDLSKISVPVLLIVGGNDEIVLELNQQAFEHMTADKDLRVIPGATHLFEEEGALEEVARLAKDWFTRYLYND